MIGLRVIVGFGGGGDFLEGEGGRMLFELADAVEILTGGLLTSTSASDTYELLSFSSASKVRSVSFPNLQ